MIPAQRGISNVSAGILLLVLTAFSSVAQPTLPDITGSSEKGIVLLSWTCQYDGVKSIAVLRSTDSNYNYSTIGYVKTLYQGIQAFADGHPYPGKNFYKLSVVFNSGLSWTCNHYGVYVDSNILKHRRKIPSNEALQKMIITETGYTAEQLKPKKAIQPGDENKYEEILKKDTSVTGNDKPQHKFKLDNNIDDNINEFIETLPETPQHKITVSYTNDTGEVNEKPYFDDSKETSPKKNDPAPVTSQPIPASAEISKTTEPKKRISLTFEDRDDINSFVETLPKSPSRKITLSYNDTTETSTGEFPVDQPKPMETKKKISVTFNNDADLYNYLENIPKDKRPKITMSYNLDSAEIAAKARQDELRKQESPKPHFSLKFADDPEDNVATGIKAKYVSADPITGHVMLTFPEELTTHHYSLKFFDKENHAVIEVPRITMPKIIMDKRNFQKKGTYKFVVRKDGLEVESGYINIF